MEGPLVQRVPPCSAQLWGYFTAHCLVSSGPFMGEAMGSERGSSSPPVVALRIQGASVGVG